MKPLAKIFSLIFIAIIMVMIVTYGIFFVSIENAFSVYYDHQMDNYANIVRNTIFLADSYTDIYNQMINDDLDKKLGNLSKELENTPLEKMDNQTLEKYKKKYNLFGLAIFHQEGNDIKVYNSTIKQEVGTSCKEWGYWYQAFQQLFRGEIPHLEKGLGKKNFWVGPRSKSFYYPGFYRFAYYYNEKQKYIINGMIPDDNSYKSNIRNLLQETFDYLEKQDQLIDGITLINVLGLEKAKKNHKRNLEDIVFEYGNLDKNLFLSPEAIKQDFSAFKSNTTITLSDHGIARNIFIVPFKNHNLSEYKDYAVAIALKDQNKRKLEQRAATYFLLMAFLNIFAVVALVLYIMKKYKEMLTFQLESNKAIETFTKNIASLPEFIYKCKIDEEGDLLLTYNDGKSVESNKYVSFEENYIKMKKIYPEDYVNKLKEEIKEVFDGKTKKFEMEYEGKIYEHFVSPVFDQKTKQYFEVIGLATDITEKTLEEDKSIYQASHDHLTGLWNRMALEQYITEETKGNKQREYAFLFLDLDKFKAVNDNYGHIKGDLVLQEVAERIRQILKGKEGIIARIGGDEFVVFLPYSNIDQVKDLAEKIIVAIETPFCGEDKIEIGVSIGIAFYPQDSKAYKELMDCADNAMYQAKKSDRQKYQFVR